MGGGEYVWMSNMVFQKTLRIQLTWSSLRTMRSPHMRKSNSVSTRKSPSAPGLPPSPVLPRLRWCTHPICDDSLACWGASKLGRRRRDQFGPYRLIQPHTRRSVAWSSDHAESGHGLADNDRHLPDRDALQGSSRAVWPLRFQARGVLHSRNLCPR